MAVIKSSGKPLKLKKLKPAAKKSLEAKTPKRAAKTADMPGQLQLPLEPDDTPALNRTAELFRTLGRPYRLSFGGLSHTRSASREAQQKAALATEVEVDAQSTKLRLLQKHELLTMLSAASGMIRSTFERLTFPYPLPGCRLYVFNHLAFDGLSGDAIEQEMGKQRELFEAQIREKIENYKNVIDVVAGRWDEVLVQARRKLKKEFNPAFYPRADELHSRLYVEFGPQGTLTSTAPETKYLSEAYQRHEREFMQSQLQEIVKLQEEAMVRGFKSAVDGLVESLQNLDSKQPVEGGRRPHIKSGPVEKVFEQFREFNNKCLRYGILSGSAFEQEINQLRRALRFDASGADVESIRKNLNDSQAVRQQAIRDLSQASSIVEKLFSAPGKRRILMPETAQEAASA